MSEVRLIDADKLIRQLEICKANANPLDYNTKATYAECIAIVKAVETIDAEPVRHGHWKEEFWTIERQRVCSVCTRTVRQPAYGSGDVYLFKYCPYCGAKMDKEK